MTIVRGNLVDLLNESPKKRKASRRLVAFGRRPNTQQLARSSSSSQRRRRPPPLASSSSPSSSRTSCSSVAPFFFQKDERCSSCWCCCGFLTNDTSFLFALLRLLFIISSSSSCSCSSVSFSFSFSFSFFFSFAVFFSSRKSPSCLPLPNRGGTLKLFIAYDICFPHRLCFSACSSFSPSFMPPSAMEVTFFNIFFVRCVLASWSCYHSSACRVQHCKTKLYKPNIKKSGTGGKPGKPIKKPWN